MAILPLRLYACGSHCARQVVLLAWESARPLGPAKPAAVQREAVVVAGAHGPMDRSGEWAMGLPGHYDARVNIAVLEVGLLGLCQG